MEITLSGVDVDSRDWDVQQHKAEVYAEFERRLQKAFPEGLRIHSFEFGHGSCLACGIERGLVLSRASG